MGEVIWIKDATWKKVADEYGKLQQMGYQAVEQAALVGWMLSDLKAKDYADDNKAFLSRVIKEAGIEQAHVYRLMSLAKHWQKIAKRKPESLRAALALIPKKKHAAGKGNTDAVEPIEDDEEALTPARYLEVFQMRVSTVREITRAIEHYAQFGAPVKTMVTELRAAARLIESLAQKLEKQL